jgi:hypothetical protein
VCQEVGFTAKGAPSDETWSHKALRDFRGRGLGVLRWGFFPFLPWLAVSLFADSERALLLADYGIPWVTFGVL